MPIIADSWRCEKCTKEFAFCGEPAKATCPTCGSKHLRRSIHVEESYTLTVSEHAALVVKDPSLPSKRKVRRELRSGIRLARSGSGRLVQEHRLIDHDAGRYEETIIDVETGQVLRDVSEPLAQHIGGTPKPNKPGEHDV